MAEEENQAISGVLAGSPAPLFENLDEDARAYEDSNPFRRARLGGGSRKGVPNRRTEDFRRFYAASGFRDPLLFLGHLITINPDELAKELCCKLADAAEMQRKAAVDLAPYLHSKQPVQVTTPDGAGVPMLIVGGADMAALRAQVASGALSIDGPLPAEENQALSSAVPDASHGPASHE